jgi:haloacid dehalogenase superfamily, subfamily IA, variant 3 with third motif having DD or ED
MDIKNIVFDVGNVLVAFRYRELMQDLGFDETTVDYLAKNMVETPFWNELDRGDKMNADAIEKFTNELPEYKSEILKFWDNIQDVVKEYDYSEGLVKDLKAAGYGVYILSNYPVETYHMHWPTFKFLPHADGYIVSGFERVIKPDEKIYRLLESRFGIKLEDSIFVDDRQINIDAANSYGMKGILFTGYDDLIDSLKKYNIDL